MKQTNEEIFLRSKSDVLYFSSLTKLYLKDQNFWSMWPVRLQCKARFELRHGPNKRFENPSSSSHFTFYIIAIGIYLNPLSQVFVFYI